MSEEEVYVLGDGGEGVISITKSNRVVAPIFELGSYYEMGLRDFKENGLDAPVYSTHNRETLDELVAGDKSLCDLFDTKHRKNIKVSTPRSAIQKITDFLGGLENEPGE